MNEEHLLLCPTPGLVKLLSDHRQLLTNSVINEVRRTEIEQEFPFGLLNDLRGYINYSPKFFEAFAHVFLDRRVNDFSPDKLIETLGAPTRMRRYFLQLVIGAFLSKSFDEAKAISVLCQIASLLEQNWSKYQNAARTKALHLLNSLRGDSTLTSSQDKLQVSTLFATAREFLDFLFLGEHSIGYQPAPPQSIGREDVVIRELFNLRYGGYFGFCNSIAVIDVYQGESSNIQFDLFRGRITGIPPYQSKTLTGYTINGDLKESHIVPEIVEALHDAIHKRRAYYVQLSESELELEKMLLYSFELSNLYALLAKEYVFPEVAKNAILQNTLALKLKREYGYEYYTDLYFHLLKQSIDWALAFEDSKSEADNLECHARRR